MREKRIWEQVFDSRARIYEMAKDHNVHRDIRALYHELEDAGASYIRQRNMRETEKYDIQIEDGSFLRLSYIRDDGQIRATLSAHSLDGMVMPLITASDIKNGDFSKLDDYASNMKAGIGHKFPDKLKEMLMDEFTPGRLISFDLTDHRHQKTYVCTGRDEKFISMKEINLGNFKDISAKDFLNAKARKLYIGSSKDVQEFYNDIKTYAGNVMPRCESINCFAQEQINALTCRVKPGHSAVLRFGKEHLHVHKGLEDKSLAWYDKDGSSITEEAAKVFIAWCHSAPVVIDISNENKLLGDKELYGKYIQYERFIMNRNYIAASYVLEELCQQEDKDFSINLLTYENSGEEQKAVSFCFKAVQGECDIYKIEYKNGDFNSVPEKITKANINDFAEFCARKLEQEIQSISGRYTQEYESRMENSLLPKDLKNRIISNAVDASVQGTLSKEDVVGAMNISDIRPDINTVIESYIGTGIEDAPVIYDKELGQDENNWDEEIE